MFFRKRPEEVKTSERHLFVNEFRNKYGAKAICRFLKISESGYYRRLRNQGKIGARQLLLVLVKIQRILSEHPDNKNYGVRRMQTALSQHGIMSVSGQYTAL